MAFKHNLLRLFAMNFAFKLKQFAFKHKADCVSTQSFTLKFNCKNHCVKSQKYYVWTQSIIAFNFCEMKAIIFVIKRNEKKIFHAMYS